MYIYFLVTKETNQKYIFYSDLVWRMQLIIIKGKKFVIRVEGIFNL